MPNYRRYRVPGGCYFFTVNLLERFPNDTLIRHVDLLRAVVRDVRRRWPFVVDGWVVLPDHLHCIWTLPPGDADFTNRWRLIKAGFARQIPKTERRSLVRATRVSEVSGSGVSGNMRSAMSGITRVIWIICISIRSSMGMRGVWWIGLIRVLVDVWRRGYIQPTGADPRRMQASWRVNGVNTCGAIRFAH